MASLPMECARSFMSVRSCLISRISGGVNGRDYGKVAGDYVAL